MRLGEVAADEAAATISMKCRATDDGVSWQIETWSVIVATRKGSLGASFRSVFERSTVSAVIHDVEAKVHKLQLIRKRHSAVQQIQMMESECLDFVPAQFVDVKLDKIGSSSPNPLNQCVRVELERSAMFHGFIVDPVDQLFFLDNSSQKVVVAIANVRRRFRQAKLQSFVHRDEDVLLLVLSLTSKLGYLERDLDQDGK